MGVLKRIRDYAAVTVFGVLTMMSGPLMEIAHADLKGVELTADTQLPMWNVSASTLSVTLNTGFSPIPNLAQDLVAGESYTCTARIHGTSGATGGISLGFVGSNGLTASPVTINAMLYNGTTVVRNSSASSLGTPFLNVQSAFTDAVIDASFTVTASGRLSLQAGQNTSNSTATTINQGSTLTCIHVGTQVLVVQPGTPPMAAPTTANGSFNYATACAGGGSCLVAEDQFTGSTLNSLWVPYVANALGGSWALSNGGSNLLLTAPYSVSNYTPPCNSASSTTSPVYTACGIAFNYFNSFPYGTTTNNSDGQHLLGGNSNGNALSLIAMPGLSTTTETSTLGGGSVSAFGRGAVWTSGAVSSAHPGSLVLPATGGYVQIRAKLPNTLSGASPSLVLYTDGGGSNDSGNEIDIQQGGSYYGGLAANNATHPPNNLVNATYRPTGFVGTFTGCTSSNSPNVGAITCSGTIPADLEKTVHVQGDTNNAIIADGGFICTILASNSVQLCQDGTSTPLTIGTITSGNTLQYGFHEVGQEFCPQSNVTTVDQVSLHVGCQTDLGVDLTAGYHVYGIEYIPGQSITIWADGNMIARYTGYGVGTSAYDIAMYVDMVNPTGITWRSVADWPSAEPVGVPPNEQYTMAVNDVQLYQIPGSVALAAPTTLNYATGCSGGTCLLSDDHWTTSTLDSTKWFPTLQINNSDLFAIEANGNTQCYGGGGPNRPFSGWSMGDTTDGTTATDAFGFDFPYGYPTDVTAGFYGAPGALPYLSRDTDGSLNFQDVTNTYWNFRTPLNAAGQPCSFNVPVTVGGPYLTNKQPILHTGGAIQFRMKTDSHLNDGEWPGLQCSLNNGVNDGTFYNTSLEWGWNWIGSNPNITALNSLEMGAFNVGVLALGQANSLAQIPNNSTWLTYHVVLLEYLGDGTGARGPGLPGIWRVYVDNVQLYQFDASQSASPITGVDYNCAIFNQMTPHNYGGARPNQSTTVFPPFKFNISDFQVWKKPGT